MPLVGISGRRGIGRALGAPRGFADAPVDMYLSEYATAVVRAGGLPVHIPLDADPSAIADRLDAVVLAGGEDVDPRRYGRVPGPHTTHVDPARDEFEIALATFAMERDIPLLGICRGQQVMNVARGGSLFPHLEEGAGESHGSYAYPRTHRVHDVAFVPGSVHHGIYGTCTSVNSFHHQSVDRPGDGVLAVGHAPDGVVEAIEVSGTRAIGVQWHPEVFSADPVFTWLIRNAVSTRPIPTEEVLS